MNKIFFNLFQDSKKDGEFFISHPSNGAKGNATKGMSKNGNPILVFNVSVGELTLKGIFNKTDPAKAKAGSPEIWASVEEAGKMYQLAGWWTTTKKSGEAVKSPYFSCSIQEKLSDAAEPAPAPVASPADNFNSIPF